jgi:hypothetical protein
MTTEQTRALASEAQAVAEVTAFLTSDLATQELARDL